MLWFKLKSLNTALLVTTFFLLGVGTASATPEYDRDAFGGWSDSDNDCQNTRHEFLAELSTGPVQFSANECRVVRGRWLDPYTDQIFTESSDLDVDHLVPLYWAWQRGAWAWSDSKREDFGNDPRNLFAVDNGTNRSKGAKGPLEWLPPNQSFHCQYVSRFYRIVLIYDLDISPDEASALNQQREQICGD
ncbi:hypothetical protein DFK10_15775 [Salibaculum griseiflavum]|uniref:GmrSD restriction endonucleases C-terminal domain-containing protein n=1 Tax=Salibaculum griseiflavum TaxID=1914409 RepID=A0A2V1P2M9_9RHOB|nr:hypothetical protein DFK10_15775 [Salibaculum griseiflavum]